MFSMIDLTPRQAEVLAFLQESLQKERVAPTYREIADHFGFKSTKAASDHIRALENKGRIRRRGRISRGIEVIASSTESESLNAVSVPIMGNIPAGQPEQKSECQIGHLAVDRAILEEAARHQLFALQVIGDSMIDRGIHDGDWVIADADVIPKEKDIVVALIDGENTLKTLAKRNRRFYLKAENPSHQDWMPLGELIIQGVARTIIRRIS
ncbi:MAG: repressor LexA [Desulfobacterales bacterium]|nr:repressor LexA [Desulfobacterales bacterium]